MKRRLLNLWIAALLALLVLDAFPSGIAGQERLNALVNPILQATGLWQGHWKLFAPNPDHLNAWLEAEIHFADGSRRRWSSPDWGALGWFQKLVMSRYAKLTNNLRLDRNAHLWPHLSAYIARAAVHDGAASTPVRVVLARRWWFVPAPEERAIELARFGQLPPGRDRYPGHKVFHEQVLP